MNRKNLKKVQQMSRLVNKDKTEIAHDFVSTIQKKLAERKYRADLLLITGAKCTTGTFSAQVKFSPDLKYPSENDLISLVAQEYPTHSVNWETIEVDPDAGIIQLILEPSVECLPISSIKAIPPEFVALGTGLFKRAANNAGTINEIWTLKKTDSGLALFKSQDDIEITADDAGGFKKGDAVVFDDNGKEAVGLISRFDDLGNAYVLCGSQMRLVGAADLIPYDQDKEKAKLVDYYTQIYGPDMGKAICETYGDKAQDDKRKDPKKSK